MPPDIKFCGVTRPEDAAQAAALAAGYVGFVFAPGPRRVTPEEARRAGDATTGTGVRRVGVFAGMTAGEVLRIVDVARLDVVQLHGQGEISMLAALRERTSAQVWTVVHVGADGIDAESLRRAGEGDGVLLEPHVEGKLGGTGRAFEWAQGTAALAPLRGRIPVILAGGLRPDNVSRAIAILAPDIVDVSSGVECSPGVKDHVRMREFVDAVHSAGSP